MSGHSAKINEWPNRADKRSTVRPPVGITAAPAGYPAYTDRGVSPLSVNSDDAKAYECSRSGHLSAAARRIGGRAKPLCGAN